MNRLIFLIIFFLSQGVLLSQSLNSWIDTDRFYFKTGVSADGIHRISLSDLNYAGVPVSAFNADNLQLFFKGNEIPIKVVKNQGVISYLEFYGERNTGWFDVDMFSDEKEQVNPYFSQITDTSAYFITWNNDFNNKRYTTTPFNSDGQAKAYADAKQLVQYTNAFYTGSEFPEYSNNKGWFDNQRITLGNTRTKSLMLPNIAGTNGTVQLDVAVVSIGDASAIGASHHLQIELPSGDIFDTTFNGRTAVNHTFQLNASQLTENNVVHFRSVDDLGVSADNMVVSYMRASYPSVMAVADENHRTYTIGKSATNMVFTLEGVTGSEQPFIIDTANHLLPTPFWNGDNWQFSLPPSAKDHFIVVAKNTLSVGYIRPTPVTFSGYDGSDFVIITSPQLSTSANTYANYRNAQIVTTDVLYNHFSYGLEKHPLAIRNFLKDAYANTGTLPKYVLLLGKSIDVSSSRNSVLYHNRNYVPTMGTPPSDNLMVAKITNSSSYQAEVAVSRLAAQTNEQVNDYLAKLRDYELQPASAWMKSVLHFGGGINVNEQTTFEAYLENYEQHIEDTLMGARVFTFLKNSSDPVQITTSDSIRNLINNGSTLMTFFGHGYSGGFDQNIDEPGAYTNENRYPLLLANSCYSGNIHTVSTSSASEKWVLIPDKGAIGFLASVSEGYSSLLNTFSGYFYRNLASYKYGEPLGEVVKQTNNQHIAASSTSLSIGAALNFTLHGDPMVVLNQFELPDIVLDNQQVQVLPREVSTAIDSFAVKFVVTNIGRTINKPINYSVVHSLPDGSDSTYVLTHDRLFFRDTITAWLPVDRQLGVGLNQVRIVADYSDSYAEISENNNSLELTVNVKSTSLFPIYPYPYAAYSHDTIVLKASTGDPFISEVFGRFEIDTVPTMNSSFKRIQERTYNGGVVQWNTGIVAEEGQTYYWRSGTRDESGEMQWQKNSFTALAEVGGWVQNTHSQLLDNELQFLTPQNNSFIFQDVPRELLCHNIGSPAGQWSNIYYSIAGQITDAACGTSAAMVVVVIDSTTFSPWFANHGDYGQINYPQCVSFSYPHALFVFAGNEEGRDNMVNFMNYTIPDGHYVLTYSYVDGRFESWKERHFEAFEALGAELIRGVPNVYPYILFSQKGYPEKSVEVVGNSTTDVINLSVNLKDNFDYGSITTPWVGPARNWGSVEWLYDDELLEPSDSVHVNIIGRSGGAQETSILESGIPVSSSPFDLSHIDASQQSSLKFQFYTRDQVNKTPAYPRRILCNFTPESDVAISPGHHYDFKKDSIQEGDQLELQLAYENTSDFSSNSKSINYYITDIYNREVNRIETTIDPIEPSKFVLDTATFQTLGMKGYYSLWVNYDQSGTDDFFAFNNTGSIPFQVYGDNTNPLLDVTFDGRRIMNGEIISSTPNISISLKDENPYISLNDTSLFALYMTYVPDGTEKRVHLQPGIENGTIIWTPATKTNRASITYMPFFEEDGMYELRVQARDNSNNLSGENDYKIQFQVINKSTITRLFNYPNPFSTSTRFVFTLTGNQLPDELSISIYTISGKRVKTIGMDELGSIFIGKNITEYAWDGRDEFGDRLANGVYLYKVNVTIDAQKVDLRKTDADGYFHRGWGKMYLMR